MRGNKEARRSKIISTHSQSMAKLCLFVRHSFCILSHTDDTSLKTVPHINQALLQFIDVMNLVDLLLHFSLSVSSMTQVILIAFNYVWCYLVTIADQMCLICGCEL